MNQMNNKDNRNDNNPNPKRGVSFIFMGLLLLILTYYFYGASNFSNSIMIPYSDFVSLVEKNEIDSVNFRTDKIYIELDKKSKYKPKDVDEDAVLSDVSYYTIYIEDPDLIPLLKKHNVEINVKAADNTGLWVYNILALFLPIALLIGFYYYIMKRGGGGIFSMRKSNAKVYMEQKTGVTFDDVAGQDEAKESLKEVVDFLHDPDKYKEIGAKIPKGALLVGPPGTGKTLLAKAVAGEAGVPFFSLAGSDFVEMFVGVGASRVRDLFKEAHSVAPCIVFIDEIDAIGKSRDSRFGNGNDEREQTLNQLLAEMDGFDSSKALLVLAATNRPDVLDKALLRPGRFDRRIIVDKPDFKGRLATLKVHSKDVTMDETVDLEAIAMASAGLAGSDLANIINEAAIIAARDERKAVNHDDMFEAFEVVAVGGKERKDHAMSEEERMSVSYHEVGHALVSALQNDAEPVQKITIVPRTMGALGYTLQTPEEEKFLQTRSELWSKIITYMGGRAAEDLVFGESTTGAANDIEQATNIAKNMVTRFGMSDEFGMMGLSVVDNEYLSAEGRLICSDDAYSEVDSIVKRILREAYDKAYSLLDENRHSLEMIADYLYDKETITGKEFMKLFYESRGMKSSSERKYKDEKTFLDKISDNVSDILLFEESTIDDVWSMIKKELSIYLLDIDVELSNDDKFDDLSKKILSLERESSHISISCRRIIHTFISQLDYV